MSNPSKDVGKGYLDKISLEPIDSQREPTCFIIYSDEAHVEYINPLLLQLEIVLKEHGLWPKTLGQKIRSSEDYLEILEHLVADSSLVLVILDGFRPNVLFEFGYAKAKRKPLIILQSIDAKINIRTLYRKKEDSGLTIRRFNDLCNPKLDVPFHFSDFAGKHVSYLDWKVKKSDRIHPTKVLTNELSNKKDEITSETTKIKTKNLPPSLQMEWESIFEVFSDYYSKEKITLNKIEGLYSKLKLLTERDGVKPPIEIYNMLSSICLNQSGDQQTTSENIRYLVTAQRINDDVLGLLLANEKDELYTKVLMKNGTISQSLLYYTDEPEHGYVAINSFKEALKIFSSADLKSDYLSLQTRIGDTYSMLADIENIATNCEQAIKLYRKVLKKLNRTENFSEYIRTQYNLGSAYYKLSEVKNPIRNLRKSIEEIEKLQKMGKLLLSMLGYYGSVQILLGTAHSNLAEIGNKREDLEKVFDFYQEALGQSTLETNPSEYAIIQNNLGAYYARMAKIEDETNLKIDNCMNAINALTEVLEVYTPEKFPREYFTTKSNMCEIYRILAEIKETSINCKKAIENCKDALAIETPKPRPLDYARAQLNLGATYATLAEVEKPLDNYKKSIELYGKVLKVISSKSHPLVYAKTQLNLGIVYKNLVLLGSRKNNCENAKIAYNSALVIYEKIGYTKKVSDIKEDLEGLSEICDA